MVKFVSCCHTIQHVMLWATQHVCAGRNVATLPSGQEVTVGTVNVNSTNSYIYQANSNLSIAYNGFTDHLVTQGVPVMQGIPTTFQLVIAGLDG